MGRIRIVERRTRYILIILQMSKVKIQQIGHIIEFLNYKTTMKRFSVRFSSGWVVEPERATPLKNRRGNVACAQTTIKHELSRKQ